MKWQRTLCVWLILLAGGIGMVDRPVQAQNKQKIQLPFQKPPFLGKKRTFYFGINLAVNPLRKGMQVVSVTKKGPADNDIGPKIYDLIIKIDNMPVRSHGDMKRVMSKLQKEKTVIMELKNRSGINYKLKITPDKNGIIRYQKP